MRAVPQSWHIPQVKWGKIKINLRVVVEQEALHDQDVGLLIRVGHVGFGRQSDAVGTGELHWVLHPAFYCVGHGLHIDGCDHCRARLIERKTMERIDRELVQTQVENIKKLEMCFVFFNVDIMVCMFNGYNVCNVGGGGI